MNRNNKKEQILLDLNLSYAESSAKDRFVKMAGSDEKWENISEILKSLMKPAAAYRVIEEISRDGNTIEIEGMKLTSAVFSTLPEEIIGDCGIFAVTLGEYDSPYDENGGISDQALFHMAETSYLEAFKDQMRMQFQEDYLVGSYFAPGLGDMPLEEIAVFEQLLDFQALGISVNGSFVMDPAKSVAGMYMFFREEHPHSTNSCETCMARGYGCNFCTGGENA